MSITPKKNILFIAISFSSILSYAQYDFLKEPLANISSALSNLVVKVASPTTPKRGF